MKFKLVFLFLLLDSFALFAQNKNLTLNSYMREVFEIIKHNKPERLTQNFYTIEEAKQLHVVSDGDFERIIAAFLTPDRGRIIAEMREMVDETRLLGREAGVNWLNAEYIGFSYDEIHEPNEFKFFKRVSDIKIEFKSNGRDFVIWIKFMDFYKDRLVLFSSRNVYDVKKEIERKKLEPFTPRNLYLDFLPYRHKDQPTKIAYALLEINNQSGFDFDYIKFKVQFFDLKNPGQAILERTFEKNIKIHKGDVFNFELKELENYNTGRDLKNISPLINVVVLDAKPKPLDF